MLSEILGYKDLLYNLTLKELKLKYKNSILGIIWSLLNPLMMIIIYTIAFKMILRIPIENYSVVVFTGLLPWLFFQNSVNQSSSSLVSNSSLISKVYFPRSILPFSIILSNFINFLLTLLILFSVVIYFNIQLTVYLLLLPFLLFFLLLFVAGVSLLITALNSKYRDTAYLMEVVFTGWFYLTPIIYPLSIVPDNLRPLILSNPVTSMIECFRAIIIDGEFPNILYISIFVVFSTFCFVLGMLVFRRREKYFVDEI
jgi:ABC-type polysaccharide/polyol phosphate export permease